MTVIAAPRFRKPAVPDDAVMRLYSWGARALYIGPALGLTAHRNAVAALAIGLDAPFGVANDPTDPSAGYRRCHSVLIPPNTLHHLADMQGRMAFLYVDANSQDLEVLRSHALQQTSRAAFDLELAPELIECLNRLARGEIGWQKARQILGAVLTKVPSVEVDPRVKRAVHRLHSSPATRVPLSELARDVGLSQSRFLHLFKTALGVPFRRYKLWIGMGAAMQDIAGGASLTAAALDAGFASSAHFSASFREMFGIEPSRLVRGRLIVVQGGEFPVQSATRERHAQR